MPSIGNIKTLIATAAIALLIGTGVGYYIKAKFVQADQTDVVVEALQETAVNIEKSNKASAEVDAKVTAVASQNATIRKAAAVRAVKLKEIARETQTQAVPTTLEKPADADPYGWTLDVGTVRLLNAARERTTTGAADVGDEASRAAAEVPATEQR